MAPSSLLYVLASLSLAQAAVGGLCKSLPGDTNWPSQEAWNQLNATVGGRLIATVPAASVCHGANPDEAACAALKAQWDQPQPHINRSGEIMAPYFQNGTCDPYTAASTPCTLGNYVSYAINVTGQSDVQAGLRFAEANDVRLVIKNTGHEYVTKTRSMSKASWLTDLSHSATKEGRRVKADSASGCTISILST
jgi:hypothetical protein